MRGIDTYQEAGNDAELNELFQKHRVLVMKIAKHYKRRLPSHIEYEDLLQSGFIGLIEAKRLFKLNMGATFETFASLKIRGSIVDSLRKNSFASRDTIKNMKRVSAAINRLEQQKQQPPTAEEIARELDMSLDEYWKLTQQINISHVVDIESVQGENIGGDSDDNPDKIAEQQELKEKILNILHKLPEKERLILSLYYLEELTLKQIAEIIELTEARVSQLHSQAIARIQSKLDVVTTEE